MTDNFTLKLLKKTHQLEIYSYIIIMMNKDCDNDISLLNNLIELWFIED